jgi:predicted permease
MAWPRIRSLLNGLFRRPKIENDLSDELRFHIETRAAQLGEKDGLSSAEARRRAQVEFGSTEKYIEEAREARGLQFVDDLRADLKFAVRMLNRHRALACIAILSLALGIGVNTIVFSVINGLLLRPLPVNSPEELYTINNNNDPGQSFPNYKDIRDQNTVFSSLFMYRIAHMSLEHGDGARYVWGYLVTGNYFESLGVTPAVGRFFTPAEDVEPNANPYAVLSYDYWQSHLNGDPTIVGQTIRVNAHPYIVLGVTPKGFQGTEVFYWPDVWLPITMEAQIEGFSWLDDRRTFNAWMAGRLRNSITTQQAEHNLKVIADNLARQYPSNEAMRLTLSAPGLAGNFLRGPVRAFTSGVMLLAALVLVAACINIASLLLARLTDRDRELSVRLSLGAGGGRIIRQLLTESLLISFIGAVTGFAFATVALHLLSQWRVMADLPVKFDVYPDLRVFSFGFLAAVLTGAFLGVVTGFRVRRIAPTRGLKGEIATGRYQQWALRDVLLVVQIALCCLLVTTSFVAARGLSESFKTYLGLQPDGITIVSYDPSLAGYTETEGRQLHQRALEALSRIPGITSYAVASSVPLSTDQSHQTVYPEGTIDFRPANSIKPMPTYYIISPKYFETLGTKLLEGREFTERDTVGSAPTVIFNETLARRVFGDRPWVGRTFKNGPNNQPLEVVGVVEDGKYSYLTEPPTPVIFFPILRRYTTEAVLIARSSRPTADVAAELRGLLRGLDPRIPVYGVGTYDQFLGFAMLPPKAAVVCLGAFGLLAAMLALTGIYGLAAYSVAQRTREIGIRVAIGAHPTNILRLIFGRATLLISVGSLAGLILGSLSTQLLARFIVGISPGDPFVLGAAMLSMLAIGIGAAWRPLRRALSIAPMEALRWE